jgi:flagellar motor switch protein FliM
MSDQEASAQDILSNDEVDALIKETQDTSEGMPLNQSNVELVDFAGSDKNNMARYPRIESSYQLFIVELINSLIGFIHNKISLELSTLKFVSYDDFLKTVEQPVLFNLFYCTTYHTYGLMVMPQQLQHHIMNILFGGKVKESEQARDAVGKVSTKISQRMTSIILDTLIHTWSELGEFQFNMIKTTPNSNIITKIPHDEVLCLAEYNIGFNEVEGKFAFCLSRELLDKLQLTQEFDEHMITDKEEELFWRDSLKSEIYDSKITLTACLPDVMMKFHQVMALKEGDVIPISDPQQVYLCSRTVRLFTALAGTANSQRVVKLLDKYKE